jgi:hypothetical protein
MEKYLIHLPSLKTHQNQILCVDDYGVEGEIKQQKWYDIIEESEKVFIIKNEWDESLAYSKSRFRKQKQNLPND